MNVKRLLLALTAVAMFAAVMANSASATMTTGGEWYIGATAPGTTLAKEPRWENEKKPSTAASGNMNGEAKLILTGTVGESGTPVKLTATGVECIEATIFNEGGAGKDSGKLKFTGVTVSEPANCDVLGGEIETNELKTELYMDSGSTHAFDKFEPARSDEQLRGRPHHRRICAISGTKI